MLIVSLVLSSPMCMSEDKVRMSKSGLSLRNHWLEEALTVPSPNCSTRPEDCAIDLLVIHNISLPPGEFGTACVDQLFCNSLDTSSHPFFAELENLKVSAHLLIDRQGSVRQYVPFDQQAWHAGVSEFRGRERCNEFSIGIELEGTDDTEFTNQQYEKLIEITLLLMKAYPGISEERIVGHSDIAPGRKTDPGPCFDWVAYRAGLASCTRTELK